MAFLLSEGQPGRGLTGDAVQQLVGSLGLPPRHGCRGGRSVPRDKFRVAVDGEQELVQQVLAHADTPPPLVAHGWLHACPLMRRLRSGTTDRKSTRLNS